MTLNSRIACPTLASADGNAPSAPATRNMHGFFLLFLFLASAVWGPTLAAQGGASTFTESIDVRVINLEVVVTDRSGERVSGLGPDDFIIKIDGEVQSIDYFTEIHEGRAIAREDRGGPDAAPDTADGQAIPIRFLLFIDGAFGQPVAFEAFHREIHQQMASLPGQEEMAVVFYNGEDLSELSGWTSSPEQLREALDSVDLDSFDGPNRLGDWKGYQASIRDELRYVAETGVRGDQATPLADLPEYAVIKKRLDRHVDRVSRAVSASLYRYAETDGRKVALLWSGGWPWSSFEFLRPPWSRDLSSARKSEESLQRVIDTANRLGYTLYMADTPFDFYDGRAELQQHETLHFLADGTGGQAFQNRHALKALDLSREDSRSYYWLGLTATAEGEGDRKKIKIKTRQRGLDVRARESWLDLSVDDQVTQEIEAAAFFGPSGVDTDDPLAARLELEFGEPEKRGRRVRVPLTVGIPLSGITMLPAADTFQADLQVRVSVIDEDGALNEMPTVPVKFSGPEPKEGDVFFYETQLEMRRKNHQVTVAVYDTVSGETLLSQQDLDL